MKYDVVQIIETLIYPSGANFINPVKPEEVTAHLSEVLAAGYEIYQAIPVTTQHSALIKYILRRERAES